MSARRRGPRPDPLDGVLVVDKPAGMTSHDVVDAVRRAAGQRRVGHTGTLDPDATGVLVLCLGRATRLARFLQTGRKTYTATIRFGVTTSTQDASGEVLATCPAGDLSRAEVEAAMAAFEGPISQIPPMVSAVRVDGERLHVRARRGEEVEREPRAVVVHAFDLDDYRPGPSPEADVTVTCGAGTYVRTLAHDLGAAVGVGAHLTALRRTHNAGHDEAGAHPLADLASPADVASRLVPLDRALPGLPTVEVDAAAARAVATGRRLPAQSITGPWTVTHRGRLLAVFSDVDGQGRPEVVLVVPEDLPVDAGSDA